MVVLVDYYAAMMDYTNGDPYSSVWYWDTYIHPTACGFPGITDTSAPTCGLGVRNAVSWLTAAHLARFDVAWDGTPAP